MLGPDRTFGRARIDDLRPSEVKRRDWRARISPPKGLHKLSAPNCSLGAVFRAPSGFFRAKCPLGFRGDVLAVAIVQGTRPSCLTWEVATFEAELYIPVMRTGRYLAEPVLLRRASLLAVRTLFFEHSRAFLTCHSAYTYSHRHYSHMSFMLSGGVTLVFCTLCEFEVYDAGMILRKRYSVCLSRSILARRLGWLY